MTTGEQLSALVIGNEDFEQVERALGVFCPFEAVGAVRHEVRHASFLAYCLAPHRPHGFGFECLRALMRAFAEAQRIGEGMSSRLDLTALDVHVMQLDGAQVRHEWRRIDLLVIVPQEKLVVAIELKIDSSEHSGQLARYRSIVEDHWPATDGWNHLFAFLTKRGDDPSEDDGEGWLSIELAAVASELERLVKRQIGVPDARGLLDAYVQMLRRHHLHDEKLEEIASRLWSQHREALEFLMERRPDSGEGTFGLLYERREELAQLLSVAASTGVVLDDCTRTNIRFAVPHWDMLPGLLKGRDWTSSNRILLIELAPSGDKRSIRVRFVLGSGETAARQAIFEALEIAGLAKRSRRQITGKWSRLNTETLVRDLDDDEANPSGAAAVVQAKLGAYGNRYIPACGEALAKIKQVPLLGEPLR